MLAIWNHRAPGKLWPSSPLVRVLAIHPHTARIEARRRDGTVQQRWVKLSRLCFVRSV